MPRAVGALSGIPPAARATVGLRTNGNCPREGGGGARKTARPNVTEANRTQAAERAVLDIDGRNLASEDQSRQAAATQFATHATNLTKKGKNKMDLRVATTDALFDSWITNFSTLLTASPTTYGLVAGDATAVAAVTATWSASYATATNPATRTSPAIADKDAAKAAALAIVRPYNVQISLNSGVTDMDKAAIGATVAKTIPTPVPPPTTVPTLAQINVIPGQISVAYRDQSTPTSKAKPPGVIGMNLFVAIGVVAATDPSQAKFFATYTKSPLVMPTQSGDRGKHATLFAQWTTRSGAGGVAYVGPFSDPLDIIIQ